MLRISRCSKDTGSTEVAFASVVIERLTGFVALPVPHLRGLRGPARPPRRRALVDRDRSSRSRRWSCSTIILVLVGEPAPRGSVRAPRELDPLHRHRARRGRPAATRSARRRRRARRRDRVPAVRRRRRSTAPCTPSGSRSRTVPCSRSSRPSRWSRCSRSRSAGSACVKECSSLLLHPLGVPTGQAVALGLLWYAMTLIVSLVGAPAFAIGHRGRHHTAAAAAEGHEHDRRPRETASSAAGNLPPAPAGSATARSSTGGPRSSSRALLLRLLRRSGTRTRGPAVKRAAYDHATPADGWQKSLGINHRADAAPLGARHPAADHRSQLLLRLAALHRHDGCARSSCSASTATTTRCGATRSRSRPRIALIGFAFWPLMPPRLLDSYYFNHIAAIPHHFGFVDTLDKYPTFWSFKRGAVNKISNQYAAMPSVHCAWALWCTCALVPRLKHTWAKVLADPLPGRAPSPRSCSPRTTTSSTPSAASSSSASATCSPGCSPAPGAAPRPTPTSRPIRATGPPEPIAATARARPRLSSDEARSRRARDARRLRPARRPRRRARRHHPLRRARTRASARCRCSSATSAAG